MKLTGCDRQTCIQALDNHESAYNALKYLKSLPTNENPAKLLNNPHFQETIKQSNKVLKEHEMLKASCRDYDCPIRLPENDHITPDNVQQLCDGLSICTTCFDKLHEAGLVRQPDEICYGNGTSNFDDTDQPEDALQGYRLKMSYDDLVFVKGQLRQLNDDGTIDNLEYTINCLNRAMQLLETAIKSYGLNPNNPNDTELEEAANYSITDKVNEALDDLLNKFKPITSDEADDAMDNVISSSLTRTADDFNHSRGTVRNAGERPNDALNNHAPNSAPNCCNEALNNSARNCCTEFNERSTRFEPLPDYMTNALNANNIAWAKLADQYEKLLNMFRIILHQQTSLLTHLIMKEKPNDNQANEPYVNPNYGNDPYAPVYDSDKPIGSFIPRRCGGS